MFCFSDTILFLSGWLLMRNATLSCITFLWMNIRVRWSFQAVGVKITIISHCHSASAPSWVLLAKQSHTLPLSTAQFSFTTYCGQIVPKHYLWPAPNTIVQSLNEKGQCTILLQNTHPSSAAFTLACISVCVIPASAVCVLSFSLSYMLSVIMGRTLRKRQNMS